MEAGDVVQADNSDEDDNYSQLRPENLDLSLDADRRIENLTQQLSQLTDVVTDFIIIRASSSRQHTSLPAVNSTLSVWTLVKIPDSVEISSKMFILRMKIRENQNKR